MLNFPYYSMDDCSIYSFDLLSDYFKSERILVKLFESAVRMKNYEKIDIIVNSMYCYLCDIIDLSDSFSMVPSDDRYSDLKKDTDGHFFLDADSKKQLKSRIQFSLSYDRESPVFLKDYSSKHLYSKDTDDCYTYSFYLNGEELLEFQSSICLFFDYRNIDEIEEHHRKYQDLIDANLLE